MVKFVDDPPRPRGPRGRVDWEEVKRVLREHPNEWAFIENFNPSVATHIRQGRYPRIDPNEYEVTSRSTGEPGVSAIYMRYVGAADGG